MTFEIQIRFQIQMQVGTLAMAFTNPINYALAMWTIPPAMR